MLACAAVLLAIVMSRSTEGFTKRKKKQTKRRQKPKQKKPTRRGQKPKQQQPKKKCSDGLTLANYHNYDEKGNRDGSELGSTACADRFREDKVLIERAKKHHWVAVNPTAFNRPWDGDIFRRKTCGKTLEVSGKGKKWKLLIVDMKGGEGVDVSQHAWKAGIGKLSKDGGNACVRAKILG